MRFLMIDKICELEHGRSARGIKNISWDDYFLEEFFPGTPVFSPVIIAEAAAQLVSWVIVTARDFTVKPVITLVDTYQCLGHVRPGDQLEVRGVIENLSEEGALAHGSILLHGKPVLEMSHAVCYLYPLSELERPERARLQFKNLYDPAAPLPQHPPGPEIRRMREQVPLHPRQWIDRVVALEHDNKIVGIKNVTATEDFFNDHFPDKPILPGVVIIECMTGLAKLFADRLLEQQGSPDKKAILKHSEKIKFRTFVQPGDQLVIEAQLTAFTEHTSAFTARAALHGKNAASMRVEFEHVTREQYREKYVAD
jgi:3-hydroxymyristoyl/3-hydroxydecanoyl-(acyl carrier protein) dehydratase